MHAYLQVLDLRPLPHLLVRTLAPQQVQLPALRSVLVGQLHSLVRPLPFATVHDLQIFTEGRDCVLVVPLLAAVPVDLRLQSAVVRLGLGRAVGYQVNLVLQRCYL